MEINIVDGRMVSNGNVVWGKNWGLIFQALTPATSIDISLNKEMLKGQHGTGSEPIGWPAYAPQLNINVTFGEWTATMAVVEDGSTQTTTLVDNEVVPQVAVFGLNANGTAYDMIKLDDQIPLGLWMARPDSVTISFCSMGQFPRRDYILRDRKTNEDYELDGDVRIALDASSIGRLVLQKRVPVNDSNNLQTETQISINGKEANVVNVGGIKQLQVLDLQGRLVSNRIYDGTVRADVPLSNGANILRVQLSNGRCQTFKFLAP